jgi:hypothetical protein
VTGADHAIYTKRYLTTATWTRQYSNPNLRSITQLKNGIYLYLFANGDIKKASSLTETPVQVQTSNLNLNSLRTHPNGNLIGITTNGKIYRKRYINEDWQLIPHNGVFKFASFLPDGRCYYLGFDLGIWYAINIEAEPVRLHFAHDYSIYTFTTLYCSL